MKKIPSKEEIKSQYGISEEDFQILTEMQTPEEVASKYGFLLKIADAFGLKAWMMKSLAGAVLAVILLPPTVKGIYDFWEPVALHAYLSLDSAIKYFDQNPSYTEIELVPFALQTQEAMIGKPTPPMGDYPPATGILPQLPSPPPSPYPDLG
jgi:hypothetical protein